MGFPSPAADYTETRISLDERLITKPSATYFMRAKFSYHREGIMSGALLVVDSSLSPCDGSLLICAKDGEFKIVRYHTSPRPHLVNLEDGREESLPGHDGVMDESPVFGVITYIINDARSGEFDDSPLM